MALLPISASAGDGAALRVLGFSPDGKRFAFEETGHADGSTFPYFRVVVVGERAGEVGRSIEHKTEAMAGVDLEAEYRGAMATQKAEIADARTRFGFGEAATAPGILLAESQDARAGEELLPMEIYKTMADVASELTIAHPALGGSARIGLTERAATTTICEPATEEAVTAKLELERAGQPTITLFDGPADLRAAGCPRRHGLVAAYLHGKALAVVFQSFPIGFEEPDRRFGAVILSLPD